MRRPGGRVRGAAIDGTRRRGILGHKQHVGQPPVSATLAGGRDRARTESCAGVAIAGHTQAGGAHQRDRRGSCELDDALNDGDSGGASCHRGRRSDVQLHVVRVPVRPPAGAGDQPRRSEACRWIPSSQLHAAARVEASWLTGHGVRKEGGHTSTPRRRPFHGAPPPEPAVSSHPRPWSPPPAAMDLPRPCRSPRDGMQSSPLAVR